MSKNNAFNVISQAKLTTDLSGYADIKCLAFNPRHPLFPSVVNFLLDIRLKFYYLEATAKGERSA